MISKDSAEGFDEVGENAWHMAENLVRWRGLGRRGTNGGGGCLGR